VGQDRVGPSSKIWASRNNSGLGKILFFFFKIENARFYSIFEFVPMMSSRAASSYSRSYRQVGSKVFQPRVDFVFEAPAMPYAKDLTTLNLARIEYCLTMNCRSV
jgi:hypothetical protein